VVGCRSGENAARPIWCPPPRIRGRNESKKFPNLHLPKPIRSASQPKTSSASYPIPASRTTQPTSKSETIPRHRPPLTIISTFPAPPAHHHQQNPPSSTIIHCTAHLPLRIDIALHSQPLICAVRVDLTSAAQSSRVICDHSSLLSSSLPLCYAQPEGTMDQIHYYYKNATSRPSTPNIPSPPI
jgi:hypothetical protein